MRSSSGSFKRSVAKQETVIVGRRNATEAVIDQHLGLGAEVIVYPNEALRDGARIVVGKRRGDSESQ